MKAPRLTKNTSGDYDLLIENGKIPMIEDGTQAAQHALTRLLIFKGEYSLDGELTTKTELGTKWYETIFAMDKPQVAKELEIKRRLLQTPGIKKILSFEWSQSEHTVTIEGKFQTDWGAETVSETVTPL